jgi:hypothetical protein
MHAIVSACRRINPISWSVIDSASLPSNSRQRAIEIGSGPSSVRSMNSIGRSQRTRVMTIRVVLDWALQRAGCADALMPMSAGAGVTPTAIRVT